MNPLEEETTQPARLNPNLAAQGAMVGIRRTPWYSEFVKEYKEEPDLSRKADYDYRKAWLSGARPEKDPHDAGRYHWPSSTASGEMLKSSTHPTHWKELYMRKTGVNPDTVGATIKDWIRIKNYADGGAVNPISAGIASLGRGPDSMLVHMSPREVAGLQTLAMKHGGSLTINPHTGLPEAGFLDSILPMVAAGATAAFMPAAAPAFLPMLAGAGVGALTNKQSPLMGALLGGLSGYGMGGLGETFGKLGAEELAKQTAQRGGEEALERLAQLQAADISAAPVALNYANPVTAEVPNYANPVHDSSLANYYADGYMPAPSAGVSQQASVNPIVGEQSAAYTPDYARTMFPDMSPAQRTLYEQMKGAGYSNADMATALGRQGAMEGFAPTRGESLISGMGQAAGSPVQFVRGNYKNIGAAAAPLISYGIGSLAQQPTLAGGLGTPRGNIRPYKFTQKPNEEYDPNNPRKGPYFAQSFEALPVYTAAEGGMVPSDLNNRYPQSNINQSAYATASQSPMSQSVVSGGYESKINPFTGEMQMAAGGATYAAGGRLLRGDGDGVSDSIPAEIHSRHGVQKAALADGEFVLPARIVSEIGNGSTEAGARKLYAMMDRIQKRRGKTLKNVAANTKAERLLPA